MDNLFQATSLIDAVVANIHDGVILVNALGKVIYHNKAASDLLDMRAIQHIADIDQTTGIRLPKLEQPSSTNQDLSKLSTIAPDSFHFEQPVQRGQVEHILEFNISRLDQVQFETPLQLVVVSDISRTRRLDTLIDKTPEHRLITDNPKMRDIVGTLKQVAPTRAPVLLQGESGTGKSMFARILHNNSDRSNGPFVMLNCAAIPETLLESELFGHVKGAFTGAMKERPGRLQTAHGGTLFLDEISEIPLHLQPKLLTALEEQRFQMVGSDETIGVDIRVIAASNQNLEQLVDEGKFRADLYYRLGVFNIEVPPLRDRQDDIPLLINHLCETLVARGYPQKLECTEEAMGLMMNYPWPGNIRELANAVEHAMILATGSTVSTDCLPRNIREYSKGNGTGYLSSEDELETQKAEILNALEEANGNRAEAARMLGIDRSTLWRRLHRLGIAET